MYALAIVYGIEWVRSQVAELIKRDRALREELERAEREYARWKKRGDAARAAAEAKRRQAEEAGRAVLVGTQMPAPLPSPRATPPVLTSPAPSRIPTPTTWPTPTALPPPKSYFGLTRSQWLRIGTAAAPYLLQLTGRQQQTPTVQALTTVQAPAAQLAPQSFVSFGGMQPPPTSRTRTKECECPPKKKRQPRKPRTVCYSGTFTERAGGLRKVKKRKVPCR